MEPIQMMSRRLPPDTTTNQETGIDKTRNRFPIIAFPVLPCEMATTAQPAFDSRSDWRIASHDNSGMRAAYFAPNRSSRACSPIR